MVRAARRSGTVGPAASIRFGAVRFADLAGMWVRASLAYRASFAMLTVGSVLIGALDFAAIVIMFGHLDRLAGFTLTEIGLLYGGTGLGLALADLVIGRVDRLGDLIRLGRLDAMMTRPVPLLVQVCADEFALRRFGRVVQTGAIFAWASTYVDWSPARTLVAVSMVASGAVIFFCIFLTGACIQFWTADAAEFANAFSHGGNALTQYPLTILPRELVVGLTFLLPLAFVNWYPALFVLGREDPFGLPGFLQFCSPVAAAVMAGVAALAWRAGVRHYRSTGS